MKIRTPCLIDDYVGLSFHLVYLCKLVIPRDNFFMLWFHFRDTEDTTLFLPSATSRTLKPKLPPHNAAYCLLNMILLFHCLH